MKKIITLSIVILLLTGCGGNNKKLHYIVDGKAYECEIVKRNNIFPTVRYLKDGEWIYTLALDSDLVSLEVD